MWYTIFGIGIAAFIAFPVWKIARQKRSPPNMVDFDAPEAELDRRVAYPVIHINNPDYFP